MRGLPDRPCSRPSPTGLPQKTWQKRQKCQVSPERVGKTWRKRQKCQVSLERVGKTWQKWQKCQVSLERVGKTWQKRQKCQVSPSAVGKTWQKCRILALAGVLEHHVPRRLLGVRETPLEPYQGLAGQFFFVPLRLRSTWGCFGFDSADVGR